MDFNNYNLGLYLRIAFNEPNKYPEVPFMKKAEQEAQEAKIDYVMSDDEMEKMVMRNNSILKGKFIQK